MYYKVELRIQGKYFNEGFVNISHDKFEGFLTLDYISGYVTESDNKKLLCINLKKRNFSEESSKLELTDMLMIFAIDEFILPEKYEVKVEVPFFEDDGTFSKETLLMLEFVKKIPKNDLSNFIEQLEQVKKGLKL